MTSYGVKKLGFEVANHEKAFAYIAASSCFMNQADCLMESNFDFALSA